MNSRFIRKAPTFIVDCHNGLYPVQAEAVMKRRSAQVRRNVRRRLLPLS